MRTIDLNADLGEGLFADEQLMQIVSSANIACGAHAGDERTMRTTIEGALARGVAIGAHPGYADREGFGRRETGAAPAEIRALVGSQLEGFVRACEEAKAQCVYVKPHGALYNRAVRDDAAAEAIADAVRAFDATLALLGPPSSSLLRAAKTRGLAVASEAFLDRAYEADGSLVPRDRAGAVIENPATAAGRAEQMLLRGAITAENGSRVSIVADSFCVHGDTPGALDMARAVRERITSLGVAIRPFVPR